MLSKTKLKELVSARIKMDHQIGENTGGSGHLSEVSFQIDEIHFEGKSQNIEKYKYTYRLFIETEFSYYPDNPPQEERHENYLFISENGDVLNQIPEGLSKSTNDDESESWSMIQEEINRVLFELMTRIDWGFGDNRAPIKYPPEFWISRSKTGKLIYQCKIDYNLGKQQMMVFRDENLQTLIKKVKKGIQEIIN